MMELVKVFNSISINEVHFVKSLLENDGIEAVIFDEATASLAPHYLFHQGGSRLMVRSTDATQAHEIIQNYIHSREK